ncbi:hypothetical protein UFOVP602_15 [uncultured Caudovirales phage]|uniref:Uncharacterized protein n=1 Tax=uncultured Caudovirales phage TaxID=2100421 RepID=A0A6J5N0G2_9CAUD|nr:hypothetical protein UFOVP602_15 [uncultured Caudovirales phage]
MICVSCVLTDREIDELQNEEEQAMIEEIHPAPERGKLNELSLEMASRVLNELAELGDPCTMTEASAMTEDQAWYRLRQAVRDSANRFAVVQL